jgi:orotidine-5'-phosphate decarboxylase
MPVKQRVIVALDVDSADAAFRLVEQLGDSTDVYTVGLQLLTAEGPEVVRRLIASGKQVFLDLKLHEIPNSVASAVRAAGRLGASLLTVHASGGPAVLRAAVDAARPFPQLKILALTVITSLRDEDLPALGIDATVPQQVSRLALLAADAGCHGVVASALEAVMLRQRLPRGLLIVTPGTQWPLALNNDQARIASPMDALRAGATQVVMGRSITGAADPAASMAALQAELAGVDKAG